MKPILEKTDLVCDKDFYLAYSPERIDPGNKKYGFKNTPKVAGGIDHESTMLAKLVYRQIADEMVTVSSPDVAEMVKLFENVFRGVNIALVNELCELCEQMKISVWEVIEVASSKPFGFMPFYPGPGIEGHCIPLDPYYLASKAREYDFHTRFIELAATINEHMPFHVSCRIKEALGSQGKSIKAAKILILGVSYKKDVADTRESPILKLIELLSGKGAILNYNDPQVPKLKINQRIFTSHKLTKKQLSGVDCVVIATAHRGYDYNYIIENAQLVFDTRGVTRDIKSDKIVRLGE